MIKHLTINSYKSITQPSSIVIYFFVSFLVYDLSAIFGLHKISFFVTTIHLIAKVGKVICYQ